MKRNSNQTALHIIMCIVTISFFNSCGFSEKKITNDNLSSVTTIKSNQLIANADNNHKLNNKDNKGSIVKSASIDNKQKKSGSETNQSHSQKTVVSQRLIEGKTNYLSHNIRVSSQENRTANVSEINKQNVTPNTQAYSPETKVYTTIQNTSEINYSTAGTVMQKGKPNGPGVEGNLPVGDGILVLSLLIIIYGCWKYLRI